MNCTNCGGRLEGNLTICPFCQSRQDFDLSQVHFRNLGNQGSLPCPGCESLLEVIEFETKPEIQIERCASCHGLFFNPGELEALLEAKIDQAVWVDGQRLQEISKNFGHNHRVEYLKCPMCEERMSHINFGGKSGVVIDRCGTHGVWLQGGELRRLMEWWRAGGKHIHQQNEQDKLSRADFRPAPLVDPGNYTAEPDWSWGGGQGDPKWEVLKSIGMIIGGIAAVLLD